MEILLMLLEAAAHSPQVLAFAGGVMLALAGCCCVAGLILSRRE